MVVKKYKLLKDLPLYQAGTEFEIYKGNLVHTTKDPMFPGETSSHVVYNAFVLEHYPNILAEWFEEIQEPKKLTINDVDWSFEPEAGEDYWCIDYYGDIFDYKQEAMNDLEYQVFKTKEEAEAVARWNEALKTVRQSSDFKPDWNDNSPKYFVVYNYEYDCLSFDRCCNIPKTILPHYSSMNETKEAAKKYEKEYKILFGVE